MADLSRCRVGNLQDARETLALPARFQTRLSMEIRVLHGLGRKDGQAGERHKPVSVYGEESLGPLGIKNTTFSLQQHPDPAVRRPEMSMRDPGGNGKAVHTTMSAWAEDVHDALGGLGVYSSKEEYEYMTLHSFSANDGKLLKGETVELMFQPHMSEKSHQSMVEMVSRPMVSDLPCWGWPLGCKNSWGKGGMLLMEDASGGGRREKSTMNWGGLPNSLWVSRDSTPTISHTLLVMPYNSLIARLVLIVYTPRRCFHPERGSRSKWRRFSSGPCMRDWCRPSRRV